MLNYSFAKEIIIISIVDSSETAMTNGIWNNISRKITLKAGVALSSNLLYLID